MDSRNWVPWTQRRTRRILLLPFLVLLVFTGSYFQDNILQSFVPPRIDDTPPDTETVTVTRTKLARETLTVTEHVTLTPPKPSPTPSPPIEPHKFREDGLLEVNSNGRHPIYDLIQHAEADWTAKLAKQSKTLEEAVKEYERRYKRAPPKGFDHWYVDFPLPFAEHVSLTSA